VHKLTPDDFRAAFNLANLAHDAGDYVESHRLYAALQAHLPDNPVIRRNTLVSMEYDPQLPVAERLHQAKEWGDWAIAKAGGARPRPPLQAITARPMRLGYVSADFCQHTVGLFVKDVLAAHDPQQVLAFVYSAGQVDDWVTTAIRGVSSFRNVSGLDDTALAEQIRRDKIDVLVDLSGHTSGSRLTTFACRPAPVQVSWLGYFATTGLTLIDAVILDEWHVSQETEQQFVEPIVRLPGGKFCYVPVPFAPAEVAPPPCIANGYITFGCFNNTSKLNSGVFDVWSRVLTAVPGSHLLLKWRTFQDESFQQSVREAFIERSIAAEHIELRGASFHVDVLKEYADIDIALDPFPFTGGLTSCESLWMGVPVVTCPQSQAVSRQTFAFLSAIGLPELVAQDADDYVKIAVNLAENTARLTALRDDLRSKMQTSSLMDVPGFTRQLEQAFLKLHKAINIREKDHDMKHKTILHIGSGHRQNGAKLPVAFQTPEWQEIRLDIDPACEPEIVGSMLDMTEVASDSVDAVYSAHNIEHVHPHEVQQVLKAFLRVLKTDGFLLITCPDLQSVCALVAKDKLTDAAYRSPAGPISPLDILFGHDAALAAGHHYMAHKGGFTLKTLTQALQAAGFQTLAGFRRPAAFDIWAVASKRTMATAEIQELAKKVLPS